MTQVWLGTGGRPGRYGDRVLPLALNVTDPARAQEVVAETVDGLGGLDVVVNNAGYANLAAIEQTSLDDFRAQVEAAFFGTVYVTKAALPTFVAQGHGHFIQVTSLGGARAGPPGG